MRNLYFLIRKNLKLLIRSKGSALIVVLAPLLIILLIGFSYNTSQTGLNIGVYASSFSEETNSFLASIQDEGYKVVKYIAVDDCVEDIKLGFVHACLALPENFQIQDNNQKEIVFYIDQTKINLVYLITDALNKKFNLKSKEISQSLTSDILTKLSNTKTKIDEKSSQVDNIKTKNQQALSQSATLKSDLASLDLTLPQATYNISILTSFKENASSSLASSLASLVDARAKVSASALNSSEKSEIVSKITLVNTGLNQLSTQINGAGAGTLEEISTLLTSLQTDLDTTKAKLTAASQKIASAGIQLTSLTTTLNEGLSSLDAIKMTLTEIQTDLASQKVTSASTIAAPITTKIEKITLEKTNLNYLFPSLIVLVIMFVSILLGTTLVMMEKHNQAYFRNFIMPVRKTTFVLATYLTNCFLILIQIVIILGIALVFLDGVLEQLPLTALILLISSSVFTLIGMMIGYLFISEDTGTLASISTGSFLLFISGVVLPLESMPTAIRQIVSFNPFVISEKLIREVFIFKSSALIILNDLLFLISYVVIFFILILIIDNLAGKHFLIRMAYKHHKHIREKKNKLSFSK